MYDTLYKSFAYFIGECMNLQVEARKDDILLTLGGRLTSADVQPLNAEIKRMLEEHGIPFTITVDMRDVVYLNASSLRALYYLVRFIYRRGGMVYFYGYTGMTQQFMELSGICYNYPFSIIEPTVSSRK